MKSTDLIELFTRVSNVSPGLEKIVEPLRNTVTLKVKANSVKQEYEKQDELKRSAMRAVAALLTIQDAGKFFCKDVLFYNRLVSGKSWGQFVNKIWD